MSTLSDPEMQKPCYVCGFFLGFHGADNNECPKNGIFTGFYKSKKFRGTVSKRSYRKIAYNVMVVNKKNHQPYRIVGRSPVSNKIILTDEKQTHMVSYYKLRKYYA